MIFKSLPTLKYTHVPHNDILVNDGPQWWSRKIIMEPKISYCRVMS